MKEDFKKEANELAEDVALFIYKFVNYMYMVSKVIGIFAAVIIIFYISGNPIGNYTSERGMLIIVIAIGIVALVRFIFQKILISKNLL